MRRLMALLTAAAGVWPAAPAFGQDQGQVRLTLLSQTAAVTPDRPLSIRVGALNGTDTRFSDLTLTVALSAPVGSRSEYDQALEAGSVSTQNAVTRALQGPLEAGGSRAFQPMTLPIEEATLADNALLPVSVELRADGGFTRVAALRSAAVFIAEAPQVPLKVSVAFVLDEPVRRRPDGVFLDDVLERSIAPDGRLSTLVSSLEAVPVPVTLVVSPLLLEELRGMGDGYRVVRGNSVEGVPPDDPTAEAAAAMLERIGAIARRVGTEVVALPYASPSVPAMIGAGLDDDLAEHIRRGRDVVAAVLGVTPSETLFRPPGSALTYRSLDALDRVLSADGTTESLLVDAGTLEAPAGLTLSPPAVGRVGSDEDGLSAVAPDPVVGDRLAPEAEDPLLAAMQAVGELSALYFEEPSVDRGAAVLFDEGDHPPAPMLQAFLAALRPRPGLSWLEGVKATRVLVAHGGPAGPDLQGRSLVEPDRVGAYPSTFLVELTRARDALAALASVGAGQEIVDQIGRNTLLAQSRYLLPRAGLAETFLESAQGAVDDELSKVHPPDPTTFTLTSRRGVVPVTLRSDTGYPVNVRLTLRASRLRFVGGARRDVTLEQPLQRFLIPVRAQTTGRFPVGVQVSTPTGLRIATSTIVIRSTAYNRVALVITIGAALFLLAWWGRRLLPRRRV